MFVAIFYKQAITYQFCPGRKNYFVNKVNIKTLKFKLKITGTTFYYFVNTCTL